MQVKHLIGPGILGLASLALAGCDTGSGPASRNFRSQYSEARTALETGQFDRANRIYLRMMDTAGPLQARLKLEYSHSLLRNGEYAQAAAQSQTLAGSMTGTARSAALSVLGVADHELAKITLAESQDREAGKRYLTAAQSAIGEVLKNDPDLDPLGALAGRQASIKARLRTLR